MILCRIGNDVPTDWERSLEIAKNNQGVGMHRRNAGSCTRKGNFLTQKLMWTIGCILLMGTCPMAYSSSQANQVHLRKPDSEPCVNVLSEECRKLGLDAVINATAFGRRHPARHCKKRPQTLIELASAVGFVSSQCSTADDGSFNCDGRGRSFVVPEKMANERYFTCEAVDRINLGFENAVYAETLFESDDTQKCTMTYSTLYPDMDCGYTNGVNVCIGDGMTLISVGQGSTLCSEDDRFKPQLEDDGQDTNRHLAVRRKYMDWTLRNDEPSGSGYVDVRFPSQFGDMVIQQSTTCPLVDGISRYFSIVSGKCKISLKGTGGNRRNPDGIVRFANYQGGDEGRAVDIRTDSGANVKSIQLYSGAIGQVGSTTWISFVHDVQSHAVVDMWF